MMLHRRAVCPVQSACAGQQRARPIHGGTRLAQGGPAFRAGAARPAGRNEDADDVIAAGEVGDSRPELLDDAGGLVAERHRQWAAAGRR